MHCDPDKLTAREKRPECAGLLRIDGNDLGFGSRFMDTREIRRKQ